ncbi:hypothetical protein [Arenimonas sp. MALMAid1274]|uniref:hypothetical protein n=1 Tax=Arenimonas sp. MALMAid1274 TaxID=3411630 RepID=UPI003B9F9233
MRLPGFTFATIIALSLLGCTARTAPSESPEVPAADAAIAQSVAPAPATADASPPPALDSQAPITSPAEAAKKQTRIEDVTGIAPSGPSRSCRSDSDCAVKDVGSCCGYFPRCVNKDARTDPAGVRAQCEKDGMSSICGFPEVSGCQCVQGLCESLTDGTAVM